MYDWDAEDYEQNSGAQFGWAMELIEKLNLVGDEDVLDLGCGDGRVTRELARRVPNGSVVGVDNSGGMVALTAQRADAIENMRAMQADARELQFRGDFDVVFSNAVLHWVRDHCPVLHGVARSLRPGGRILLQMGGEGNAADVLAAIARVTGRARWAQAFDGMPFPYGFHGPSEYGQWLSDAGLVPRRVELIPKDMVHQNTAGLAGWLRTTWLPFTERVAESQRDEFIGAVVDEYLSHVPVDTDGRTHVRMVRLEVEAEHA